MLEKLWDFIKTNKIVGSPSPFLLVPRIWTRSEFNLPTRESPDQLLTVPSIPSTKDFCQPIDQGDRLRCLSPVYDGAFVVAQTKTKEKIRFRSPRCPPKIYNIGRVLKCLHLRPRNRRPQWILQARLDLAYRFQALIGIQMIQDISEFKYLFG
jgi:hypothetical protein